MPFVSKGELMSMLVFSTIARWRDGKIVKEYLMYDNSSFLQQLGLA
jgi:hypothetical protein